MKKKLYLKTVEDVLALKDTNTKIYVDNCKEYYEFIDGILCRFRGTGDFFINASIWFEDKPYILEEEPMQEATEDDLNKLCWFWDIECEKNLGILCDIDKDAKEPYHKKDDFWYYHCRRLSPAEVAEITGYKVEEK